ncbi:MAG: tryptophan synthase subunit alpha [Kiritimatiellales bacterium]
MKPTRIDRKFAELKRQGRKGFIAYIGAGDPTLDDTVDIVLRLEDAGVDIVELGLPFSDPLADGRVNQDAAGRALAAGATFDGVMNCIRKIRERSAIPMMFYAYINPLYKRGFETAMHTAAGAGIDGFLLLDLPFEEAGSYQKVISGVNLNNIMLITPTTPETRIKKIMQYADGFVYCVSTAGITGVRSSVAAGAPALVALTRKHTRLPVALGFGIGTPAQAAEVAEFADAVVVGSAIVNRFHNNPHTAAGRAAAASYVSEMVRAVKGD